MSFLRWFFDEVLPNVIANWMADAFSPASMTGWAFVLATIVWLVVNWHRRQRVAKKPGMASWPFIAVCIAIALLAVAGASYGLGLKFANTAPEVLPGLAPEPPQAVPLAASPPTSTPAPVPAQTKTLADYPLDERAKIRPLISQLIEILNTEGADAQKKAEAVLYPIRGLELDPHPIEIAKLKTAIDSSLKASQAFRKAIWGDFLPSLKDYKTEITILVPYEGNNKISNLLQSTVGVENVVIAIEKLTPGQSTIDGNALPLIAQSAKPFADVVDQYGKWLDATVKNAQIARERVR